MIPFLRLAAATMPTFGGEDPTLGRPWYHREITHAAALGCGWSGPAAADLAWHALAVDDYLYNPLRRFPLDPDRRRAIRALRPSLVTLHFDDLPEAAAVETMWDRYTAGCVAAVLWCAGRSDVGGARHAVGATLHALQDFYSHSNWLDVPSRRTRTWWEVPAAERAAAALVTASFARRPGPGAHAHGSITVRGPGRRTVPTGPATAFGSRLLGRLVDLRPTGMSLDTRWQAAAGHAVRGLTDVDPGALFEDALTLARRTSAQWLGLLDGALTGLGAPVDRFWAQVRTAAVPAATRARAFDDPAGQPARLLAAAEYPPAGRPGTGWYLRVGTAGRARLPQPLGPYPDLPEQVTLAMPDRDRATPVEVYAFRPGWPVTAGVVHGPRTTGDRVVAAGPGRTHRLLHLDRSRLVTVPLLVSAR